tara:strand:- start:1614 stop:1844 length:231 start_codon:yes stop_codon:yes gene_type:complete
MSNPFNKKYLLQEIRDLKANEFVYRDGENPFNDSALWHYLNREFSVEKEDIEETELPNDHRGNKMRGFRILDARKL